MMINIARLKSIYLPVVAAVLLSACGDSQHSDLEQYVGDTLSQQKSRIEPLPEFKPYPVFVYDAGDLRDPFAEAAFIAQQAALAIEGSGVKPPTDRETREPLEEYPLDTLRMVGTLEQAQTRWALIRDSDGSIHRVKTGNYLGKNYGKITAVGEFEIEILEIIPNGLGAYIERPTKIALSEGAQQPN